MALQFRLIIEFSVLFFCYELSVYTFLCFVIVVAAFVFRHEVKGCFLFVGLLVCLFSYYVKNGIGIFTGMN